MNINKVKWLIWRGGCIGCCAVLFLKNQTMEWSSNNMYTKLRIITTFGMIHHFNNVKKTQFCRKIFHSTQHINHTIRLSVSEDICWSYQPLITEEAHVLCWCECLKCFDNSSSPLSTNLISSNDNKSCPILVATMLAGNTVTRDGAMELWSGAMFSSDN